MLADYANQFADIFLEIWREMGEPIPKDYRGKRLLQICEFVRNIQTKPTMTDSRSATTLFPTEYPDVEATGSDNAVTA